MSITRNVLLHGVEAALLEKTRLRAGPLVLTFVSGELHNISLGDREVLRRIYFAVRDRNWRTVPARVVHMRKQLGGDSFEIDLKMENRQAGINFQWSASIRGFSDGTIRFATSGTALSTFLKNRIGICALHPVRECAGRACTVETCDGSRYESSFPQLVSPHQVFKEVRSITHEVTNGVLAEVQFEGDRFETEDQRNWSDASYKTYCPPLDLPHPNEIRAGESVSQCVTLRLQGGSSQHYQEKESPIRVKVDPSVPMMLPSIGLGVSSTCAVLDRSAIRRLHALKLSHLRVDLNSAGSDVELQLRNAIEEADLLGCGLEIALFLSEDGARELDCIRSVARRLSPPVCRWLIFHRSEKCTTAKWLNLARSQLKELIPTAKIGGGTNAYFAELNRHGPTGAEDVISASLNPQVHGFDYSTLAENLEAQGSIVRTARCLWPELPFILSPITLRPRFNPDATAPETGESTEDLPFEVDERQMSLFGAGWTVGSLKHISEAGVYSATFYETVGWRGVMEHLKGSPLPEKFKSVPGSVFPLYHVFADHADFVGGHVLLSSSSSSRQVESLALKKNSDRRLLLANLTCTPRVVCVDFGERPSQCRVSILDESSAEWAMTSPESFRALPGRTAHVLGQELEIELSPFAIARFDYA